MTYYTTVSSKQEAEKSVRNNLEDMKYEDMGLEIKSELHDADEEIEKVRVIAELSRGSRPAEITAYMRGFEDCYRVSALEDGSLELRYSFDLEESDQ